MDSMTTLIVKGLRKTYRTGEEAIKGVDFSLEDHEFVAIIGPSGAGKSTLIRCLNRLVEPTEGSVIFNGSDITRLNKRALRMARRNMGMIFQEFNLIERMSVMDNILSGRLGYMSTWRSVFRLYTREDVDKALKLLERVGLEDHIEKRADELSGGQRQRVGIARALIQDPKILLVDEPTSSLDPRISTDVMKLIKAVAGEINIPVICNIHDVELALRFADRVIGLREGVKRFEDRVEKVDKAVLRHIYGETASSMEA